MRITFINVSVSVLTANISVVALHYPYSTLPFRESRKCEACPARGEGGRLAWGLFALRGILFVLQKNLSTRNHFQCEGFF